MSERILFDLKRMKLNKVHSFEIDNNSKVSINGVMFTDKFISGIEIVKHSFEDGKESLFIHAYIGNLQVSTVVAHNDYVVSIDKDMGHSTYYWISKAESYDYKTIGGE